MKSRPSSSKQCPNRRGFRSGPAAEKSAATQRRIAPQRPASQPGRVSREESAKDVPVAVDVSAVAGVADPADVADVAGVAGVAVVVAAARRSADPSSSSDNLQWSSNVWYVSRCF
ncbi:hypothetical protein Vafri_4628 [Volvox africanus]|uniref:Uncharacterized protein n=1 Tax=Volvox africanus TaxID=51714 RepID=A0A8J4AV61_9CHLO|nr:hypothetical protein Vafri_4628 [Volvox africanus]